MISRQKYIGALNHPDFFVRSGVLRMFSDDDDKGTEVTAAALLAIDQYGVLEAFEFPHMVCRLALDEPAAEWVFRNKSSLKNTHAGNHFLNWVGEQAPLEYLREKLPTIEAAASTTFVDFPWLLQRLRERLNLLEMSPEACLARLREISINCFKLENFSHALISEANALCAQLVRGSACKSSLEQLTRDWLSFDFLAGRPCVDHWLSGLAIELAGHLNLYSTIPRLIEHFEYDWDWWNEAVARALGRMRSPKTLEVCAALYPALDWHARLFLSAVFDSPRIPEAEPLILGLLKNENDDRLRVNLGCSLALLGTPTSREVARNIYAESPRDPERLEIAETLYYQFLIEGIDDPDLQDWRMRMERMRRIQQRYSHGLLDPVEDSPFLKDSPPPSSKVGRNDPCPCGSNKKFKKCCFR